MQHLSGKIKQSCPALPCPSETPVTRAFIRSHMNNFANLEPGQIMSEIFHVLFQSFLVQNLDVETILSFYSLPLKLLVDTRLRLLLLRTNQDVTGQNEIGTQKLSAGHFLGIRRNFTPKCISNWFATNRSRRSCQ